MVSELTLSKATPLRASVKYNPHLWDTNELRAIFVVRQAELQRITQVLEAAAPDGVRQHILITGQRGMGKSTLLQRLALAVSENEALRRQWIALTFPEEQYTVSTLAEFWRNVLDALADALERDGADTEELTALDGKIKCLGNLPSDKREESSLGTLVSWVNEHKRGVLLLIDSTDQLFSALSASAYGAKTKIAKKTSAGRTTKANDTPLWRLRKVLSHEEGIFWIGASYQALEASDLYNDAFNEFFELVELRPLSVVEMRTAMLALARVFGAGRGLSGEEAVAEMTRTLDARPERLEALRALTGGNPRTTVMLYELLSAASDDNVHGDIKRLLDIMTPLYKSRLERLADQPRKILAHLLEHWAPMAIGELAEVSGIPNTTVSGQLVRLEADGFIEKTKLLGTTRSGYQASERFFNVWYLMRYAARRLRQRLSWLIEFMRLWYSREELAQLASVRAGRHAQGLLGDLSSLEYSRAMAAALSEREVERFQLEWAVYSAAYRESRRQHMAIEQALPGLFEKEGDDQSFASAEDYQERLDALDAKLARSPEVPAQDKQAWVRAIKGSVWLSLAEKESIATEAPTLTPDRIRELIEQFGRKFRELVEQIGEESANRVVEGVCNGEFFPDFPDSKVAYSQLIDRFGKDGPTFCFMLRRYAAKHRDQHVEQACRRAIGLAPTAATPWRCLGMVLSKQTGRHDEAETAYRKSIELDPKWAMPWDDLGDLLRFRLKRYNEAEAAYRKSIDLDPKWAMPWDDLGDLLQFQLKRYDEAEAAYRKSIELDPKRATPWEELGALLQYRFDRYDEAETAHRKAIELDPMASAPWGRLGDLLRYHLERYDEAEAAYRKAIELDPNWAGPWGGLGDLLRYRSKRYDDAEAAYRKFVELEPTLAVGWDNLGNLLHELHRFDESEVAHRKAIELEPNWAPAWDSLGHLLQYHIKRYDEAEVAYRKAIEIEPRMASAWDGLGDLLQFHLKRYDEAESAYRKAIEVNPKWVAAAWEDLGALLQVHSKRYDEAEAALRKAIDLDSKRAAPWRRLGDLLQHCLKRYDEAETAYRNAIDLDPKSALPWDGLGDLLKSRLKRYDEAEAAYRKAIELDPQWSVPWNDLGYLLQSYFKRYDEAESAFRKAIELAPDRISPLCALGNLLQDDMKRYEDAEAAYRRAITLDSTNNPYLSANLARLLALMGRHAEATTMYRRAVELVQQKEAKAIDANRHSQELLLQAHLWLGNSDLAAQALDELAQLASGGDGRAFGLLREQVRECSRIGLSTALADLMEASSWGGFLQPLSLALRAATAGDEALAGAAPEISSLAQEVRRELIEM